MGTNYYLKSADMRNNSVLHIGKSSSGWCFSLQVYPEENINTLEDWIRLMLDGSKFIVDEYDEVLTIRNMLDIILIRGSNAMLRTQEFLDNNHAIGGPNGLLRSKVDGDFCVGHGMGTYDLKQRDFS